MNNKMINQIEQLETKISFQEVVIDELSQTVILLQSEMIKLKEQLSLLSKRLQIAQVSNIATMSEETPPPHY